MDISYYRIKTDKPVRFRAALVSDFHSQDPAPVLELLKQKKPDFILMPGDIFNPLDGTWDDTNGNGFKLLSGAVRIAPVYYSYGNHELGGCFRCRIDGSMYDRSRKLISYSNRMRLIKTGAVILNQNYIDIGQLRIGGLTSGILNKDCVPDTAWLSRSFTDTDKFKILLCHHTEYYPAYLKKKKIDMIVSGHAHGGQFRFFGRGFYAPGQGLFPKYFEGIHDGRLIISRGCANTAPVPRLFNPCEICIIKVNE